MPDDAVKSTDAKARSAGDAKAQSAPAPALPSGVGVPPVEASKRKPSIKAEAAAKPTVPLTADAARTDGGAAAKVAAAPSGAAERREPTLSDAAKSAETKNAPKDPAAATPAEATLIGVLDADERIRQAGQQGERTLWTSAALVTLLYASLIGYATLVGGPLSLEAAQEEARRHGQDAQSISVELVPDPDKTAKTKRWQEGAAQQTPTPNDQPPQPEQLASIEQPEVPEVEKEPTEEPKDEPRPEGSPMLLDIDSLVDAAASDFKRNLDHALAKRPQKKSREQQATLSGGGMQVRGTGASGKSDAFSRTVIAALMKTRPGPFALWGRVLVSFEISPSGRLNYVHLLRSSGNSALDKAAVDAIHKARFEVPPPGLSAEERTYIIDYIFG